MQSKQFLKQAYRLNELIESNKRELEELRIISQSVSGIDYSKLPSSGGSSGDAGYTKMIHKIVEMEKEIQDEINDLLSLKLKIRTIINDVIDNEERLLLKLRYLNFLTWDEIALTMHVADRTVHRIHSKALSHVKIK